MTLEEVQKLDISEKHVLREEFTPTRIPTMKARIKEKELKCQITVQLKT
jgi:hypothetical protein